MMRPVQVRALLLAAVAAAAVFSSLARGGENASRATAKEIVLSVKTFELPSTFKTPWQVSWIPGASKIGAVAFTDRTGNQVGLLDPETGRTQTIRLNVITNPGPIAVIDNTRFAIAGTGGVGIFDRSGTGTIRELQMAGTRNTVLALGDGNRLFVADAQSNDLRIIRPPYGGPADITKFPLPAQCRGPTGVVPGPTTITVLCGQTNNIVRMDYTGNFGSSTPLPFTNMGAQEARPSPAGFVFSGFNANRVTSWAADYPDPYDFLNVSLNGPAVATVGLYGYSRYGEGVWAASKLLGQGKRPKREFFFNTFTPSYKGAGISFGTFTSGTAKRPLVAAGSTLDRLKGKNLVGSANGPGGSMLVADATPGKPAIHQVVLFNLAQQGITPGGGRRIHYRLTKVEPDFLERMTMPFFSAVPPREVRAGIVGASASPWNLKSTFTGNFGVKLTAQATTRSGDTYAVRVQSADTGAYSRVYRFTGFKPRTKQLTFTLRSTTTLPASFQFTAAYTARNP